MSSTVMAPGKTIAGYKVLAQIGVGAASELYAVQDPKSKQVWALKHVLRTTDRDHRFVEQVEQEYEIGSRLDHPAIRGVHKIIKHRKMLRVTAISMLCELVDATPLDQQPIRNCLRSVRIFHQVAEGLAHMHQHGYVHADMKPSNLLVSEDDVVKIIDLGQACALGTIKKRIQGTPGYMAPEQAHRDAITAQTDIYNFGATMYWILCREVIPTALPPKDDTNSLYSGALDPGMVDAPVPPEKKRPDIHPLLSKLILDCVKLDPSDRPGTMEQVAKRLELIGDLIEHGNGNGNGNNSTHHPD